MRIQPIRASLRRARRALPTRHVRTPVVLVVAGVLGLAGGLQGGAFEQQMLAEEFALPYDDIDDGDDHYDSDDNDRPEHRVVAGAVAVRVFEPAGRGFVVGTGGWGSLQLHLFVAGTGDS